MLTTALILAATLTPMPDQAAQVALTGPFCIGCGYGGLADFLLNVALFLPLGAALGAAGYRARTATLVGVALATTVELLQFSVIPGRDATIGDVVANTVGAGLGWMLVGQLAVFLRPPPKAAALLAAGWALVALAGTVGAMALFEPSLPDGPWYGQWAAGGPEPEWFEGEVRSARLGGRLLPHGLIADWQSRRQETRASGEVRLEAEIVAGKPPQKPLRIVAVATGDGRLATLTQNRRDLHWNIRLRASDFGLRSPPLVLRGGMPGSAGDVIAVGASYGDRRAFIQVRQGERALETRTRLRWTDGWRLLLGTAQAGRPMEVVLTGLWLLGLLGPLLGWTWLAIDGRWSRRPGARVP